MTNPAELTLINRIQAMCRAHWQDGPDIRLKAISEFPLVRMDGVESMLQCSGPISKKE